MKNRIHQSFFIILIFSLSWSPSAFAACEVNLEIQGDNNNEVCYGADIVVRADLNADCPNANSLNFAWDAGGNTSSSQFLTIDNITNNLTVSVTVTDDDGLNETDQFTIIVGDNWSVDVELDPNSMALCDGNDIDFLAEIQGDPNGNLDYNWSSGLVENGNSATDFNANSGNRTYSVVATDDEGCANTGALNITVRNLPNINISGSTVWCEDDDILITATPDLNCVWTFPNNVTTQNSCTLSIPQANTSDSGEYTITITSNQGCVSTEDITLVVSSGLDVMLNPSTFNVCVNQPFLNLNPNIPNGTYTIDGSAPGNVINGNNFFPSVAGEGSYEITYAVNQGSCSGETTIALTVVDAPAINFDNLPTICLNSPVVDLNQYVLDNPGGTFYNDDNEEIQFADLDPANFGVGTHVIEYRLNAGGCESSEFEDITINPAFTVSTEQDVNICLGTAVNLEANASGGGGGDTYSWQPDNLLSNPETADPEVSSTLSGTTTFTVEAQDQHGCMATATQTVNVNPQPVVFITMEEAGICEGDEPTLQANVSGGFGTASYEWKKEGQNETPGNADGSFETGAIFINTSYTVSTSFSPSSAGCGPVTSEPFLIVPEEEPAPIIIADGTEVCSNQWSLFTASNSKVGSTFSWEIFYPMPNIIETIDLGSQLLVHWGENNSGSATVFVEEKLNNDCFGTAELMVSFTGGTAPAIADIFLTPVNEILVYNDSTACQYQWSYYDADANDGQGEVVTDLPNNNFQSFKPQPYDPNLTYFCTTWSGDCTNLDCSTTAVFRHSNVSTTTPEQEPQQFKLFPNPNFGNFRLEVNKLFPNAPYEVQIFNSLGTIIQSENIYAQEDKIAVDIEALDKTAGVYYLVLRLNGAIQQVQGFVIHPN